MKKKDCDISHEQAEIISERLYKTKAEQKAYYAGWMECAERADVMLTEVQMHFAKKESKLINVLGKLQNWCQKKGVQL